MGWEEVLSNPIVLLAIGWAANEWRRSQDANTKAVKVDADVLARLKTVEAWQQDHHSIHACIARLTTKLDAWGEKVDRFIERMEGVERRRPLAQRSPYDFPGARDFLNEGEAQ